MKVAGTLELSTPTDSEILISRFFDAPPRLVFDAYTKPELVSRWMTGPDGWSFVTCEIDLRVGGSYRYVWARASGHQMGVTGVFREVEPAEKLVFTERFDEAWYPGEGSVSITLIERDGGTLLNERVRYESLEARDTVLRSGMETGVAAGFDRLDEVLRTRPVQ